MTDPGQHVRPPLLLGGSRPLGHRDAVEAWENRLGNATMRLVCEEPDDGGTPCRTKIGRIFNGDNPPGPLVQTFISDREGGDGADDIVAPPKSSAGWVWFLDDDGSAGWRGPYRARCLVNHRHFVDERSRRRLQAAVRTGLREVVFASTDRRGPPSPPWGWRSRGRP